MAALDLKPYGVNFVLRPGVNTIKDIKNTDLASGDSSFRYVDREIPSDFITVNGKKYTHLEKRGSGTYGTTYRGTGPDGKQYAIKTMGNVYTPNDILLLMQESIQQIIISEHTKHLPNGPYAPMLYAVGHKAFPRYGGIAFIVTDLMDDTVWNLISSQTKNQNDVTVPFVLEQAAIQLRTLQHDLKFNHRDLKTDNIMYKKNPDGTLNIKLIDFGFTCLTWNGMFINGGEYFKTSTKCNRETRDISQLVTSMMWFHDKNLSPELKRRLRNILKIEYRGTGRYRGKREHIMHYMDEWGNSYNILDNNNFVLDAGKPQTVYDEMDRFTKEAPIKGKRTTRKVLPKIPAIVAPAPAVVDICPPDKIMNPVTGRCVLRTGAIGRKLEKEMAAPAPAVVAVAPVPAAPAAAASGGCPPGKIRNPKTRRCVKRDGAIGKKIP